MITCNTSVSGQINKLRVYKLIKQSFTSEPYLDHLKDFHSRKMITKFRCSDHTLEIERRRHKKLKLEDRKCQICNYGIETEKHFLQECPGYASIRNKYFGKVSSNFYLEILQCKERSTSYKLLNYLSKALRLRDEMLALPKMKRRILDSLLCHCF